MRRKELNELAKTIVSKYSIPEIRYLIKRLREHVKRRGIYLRVDPQEFFQDFERVVGERRVVVYGMERFNDPEGLARYICSNLFQLQPVDRVTKSYLEKWAVFCVSYIYR